MTSGFCLANFVSRTVGQCGVLLPIHALFKLLDRVVSGARFLTRGVLECDIAHHRSVAVLCIIIITAP